MAYMVKLNFRANKKTEKTFYIYIYIYILNFKQRLSERLRNTPKNYL